MEECIKEQEQEEEKRRKEEEAARSIADDYQIYGTDDNTLDGTSDLPSSNNQLVSANGKKSGNTQKKKNIKSKMSHRKSVKKSSTSSSDLMTKLLTNMEKHKEVFFVIRLLDAKQVANMGPIHDPDPCITCDLMNGRDEFLNFARERHHEFSTLRRTKYSTMSLLYELHNQSTDTYK